MKILFCNIAWMKYYVGNSDKDKPINGGSYIRETKDGGECYNFQDYNGYCYGYVMLNGNMALDKHFEGVSSNQSCVDDVLVIWVATNKDSETRIVGWYKNATVYREDQNEETFTDRNHSLYYRIKAQAKDCYLLPEDKRTFPIERASTVGPGMGMGRSNIWYAESQFARNILIPKVVDYIENYNGEYANIVYSDDMLKEVISSNKSVLNFSELFNEGEKCYKNNNILEGLKYYNTARLIKETPDLLFNIAEGLFLLNCFDKARPIFEKVIKLEGETIRTLNRLMYIHDFTRNKERALHYCKEIISLLGDTKEDIEQKVIYYFMIFCFYVLQGEEGKARRVVDIISNLSTEEKNKNLVEALQFILGDVFDGQVK